MKIILLLLTIFTTSFAHGLNAWEGCRNEVLELTNGTKDEQLLKEADELLIRYGMGQCYVSDPSDQTVDLIVGIHEGVRFLDLGLDKYDEPPDSSEDIDLEKMSFIFPSLERFPYPENNIPSVKSVLERYFERQETKRLGEMSFEFQDFYEAYVAETPMLSSMYLIAGGGTEFNAYTHGLWSAVHFSELKKMTISSLLTQRFGMLFFANIFNAFYAQLRYELGREFTNGMSPQAILFQRKLFQFAYEALNLSGFCKNLSQTDRSAISDFNDLLDPIALRAVIGSVDALAFQSKIQCQ